MKRTVLSGALFAVLLVGWLELAVRQSNAEHINDDVHFQGLAPEIIERQRLARLALAELHTQSLFANEADWLEFYETAEDEVSKIRKDADLKSLLTTALNELRDHHGRFIYKGQIFAHFNDWETARRRDTLPTDEAMTRRFELEHTHTFKLIDERTGYVKIKGIGPSEGAMEKAIEIRSNLEQLARNGAQAWILDLRYNTGGNMIPMMGGLGPLFCDGVIAAEANGHGDIVRNWSIEAGNFYYGENTYVQLPPSDDIACDSNVVVLISRYTASSGEALATAFKQRPNSTFIGEPTGGYTTVTNWRPIGGELIMSVSVSYYADRTHQVFKTGLQPDKHLTFIPELSIEQDLAITAAREWLAR